MSNDKSEEISNSRFSIPDATAAPKPEPTPKYRQKLPNFADNEETVKKALEWASNSFKYCKNQEKRDRQDDLRTLADSMWRVDKTRSEGGSEESENVDDTRSDFPSTSYFETVKVITAGEKSVVLGNAEELPMEYEPLPGAEGYQEDEALTIAEEQNTVLAWAMEQKDSTGRDMYKKIGSAFFFTNKYADQVLEMNWDYQVDTRWVPEITYEDQDDVEDEAGVLVEQPRKFKARKFVEKKVTIANNPRLDIHDMADCMFDAEISDVQNQNFFDIRKEMQLCDVFKLQESGFLMNVGQIRSGQFNGELEDEKADREDHKGGTGTTDNQTNLVEIHKARIRIPVDKDGNWDEATQIPTWHETWWAGDLEGQNAVCLAISPNPHHNKKIPVMIMHAFEDDNGAFHLGNPELLKSGYSMLTTIINQYFDNVRERNQAPMLAERGSIGKRFTTVLSGGNRIIWMEPGFAEPKPLEIKDTTQQTFQAIEVAKDMNREAAGLNKPLLGEGLGSRASASESINTMNQALKPALEDAKYKADQILPFCAEWVMRMTRQFSDPDQQIAVKYKGIERTTYPGRLWGEQIVRVVAIKKLQDNILRVQKEEQMMNQYLPAFGDLMSPEGKVDLAKQIAKSRDFENVDSWFPEFDDYDARHVAKSESIAILMERAIDFPKQGENHKGHIEQHKADLATYIYAIPTEEQDKEGLSNLKSHIGIHERMASEKAQPVGEQPQQVEGIDEGQARTAGEGAGDVIAGEAGSLGNAETAATGRPPEVI